MQQNNTKAAKVAAPAIQSPSLLPQTAAKSAKRAREQSGLGTYHLQSAAPVALSDAIAKMRKLGEDDGILVEYIANGAGPDTFCALWQLRNCVNALEARLREVMQQYVEGLRGEIETLETFEANAFKDVPAR